MVSSIQPILHPEKSVELVDRTDQVGPFMFVWPEGDEKVEGEVEPDFSQASMLEPQLDFDIVTHEELQQITVHEMLHSIAITQPAFHQDAPRHWSEIGWCCMTSQPADYRLTQIQLERFQELKRQFVDKYDRQNFLHEQVLRELFKVAISVESSNTDEEYRTAAWMKIGFQGSEPRNDFRAGGFLSLLNLYYFTRYYPRTYQQMVQAVEGRQDFMLALISINVTSRLMSYFHMNEDQQLPDWHNHPKSGRYNFKVFAQLNSQSKQTFFIFHNWALIFIYNSWAALTSTNATTRPAILDFKEMMQKAMRLIDNFIYSSQVTSIKDLDERLGFLVLQTTLQQ